MKLFCAYAYTGENLDSITKRMKMVVANLQKQDNIKAIFQVAFKNITKSDAPIAIITSPSRSIGQIMEIGIAMSQGKPIFLFEHSSAEGSSYLPRLVDKYFQWDTEDELKGALRQL